MKVCFKSNGIKRIGWVLLWVALSGWDFSEHSIPLNDILSGGPAKDGIPAIDRPRFVPASQASRTFLDDGDRVMALVVNGKKKVYPLKILNWHEIVNDSIGGRRVVVTFCPLCGTGMVFDAHAAGRPLNFGVSGLLYKSNVLLYDRQTESLWSQIKQEAVTGKLIGTRLQLIPSTQTPGVRGKSNIRIPWCCPPKPGMTGITSAIPTKAISPAGKFFFRWADWITVIIPRSKLSAWSWKGWPRRIRSASWHG